MSKSLRIVLAQLNLLVGDIEGNLQKHIDAAIKARDDLAADVIVFPELSLTGYPPEDLLLRKGFLNDAREALMQFISSVNDIYCVVGHPDATSNGIYNSCSLIYNHSILGKYAKQHLPNYEVFDEYRYFKPGNKSCVVPIKGILTGLVICEDLWFPGPAQLAASHGARLILSPNASPFEIDKHENRVLIVSKRAQHNNVPIVYVNNIGGQDELIFDGGSMVFNENGKLCHFAGFFNETLLPVDINIYANKATIEPVQFELSNQTERIYRALVLGVRDYIEKNKFPGVLVGVSGGIDSALTLTIATDALGSKRVQGILMPSRYTADISIEDAMQLINALKVQSQLISIEKSYASFLETLAPSFDGQKPNITEENIQARCRAIILMALSNKSGNLVLTTGNRSELAVGYCTLYGDMAGGFAVLKDVTKTQVYELAKYRNSIHAVIPDRTLTREPTAELAPNQRDEDSLPPYSMLDQILERYLNKGQSITDIVAQGFNQATVEKVVHLIRQNEYKRRQSPAGTRINHQSFGKDWRYPITNGFKG